ncbi:MAG TPA: PaaI family thioesterase [Dehalococcoidia bacterium]|nr:PaaI family thioesterase [Dehalococcoidia bacterium]
MAGASVTGLDVMRAVAEGVVETPPAAALLGWKALELEPGHVRVRYTARPEFGNPQGAIQGGFLAAMLDDAMGPALVTLLGAEQFAPTIELKVNFMRPARPGPIIAEGRVVHRTRSLAFLEGTLRTEDGELIATGTATARINGGPGERTNGHMG